MHKVSARLLLLFQKQPTFFNWGKAGEAAAQPDTDEFWTRKKIVLLNDLLYPGKLIIGINAFQYNPETFGNIIVIKHYFNPLLGFIK